MSAFRVGLSRTLCRYQKKAMFERKQTIAEYTRHLPNPNVFTLRQAFSAMGQFYSLECDGCEDDGLAFVTGVFDEDSPNLQIALSRFYDMHSQLTVTMKYRSDIRSRLIPKTHIASTDRSESTQFYTDITKTRAFWLFKNSKPLTCSIEYVDADDRSDEYYSGVAKFAATM